jgi:hypothetical protein
MARQAFALLSVFIGLLLGLAGNLLFYGQVIGLSFPIFIGLSLVALMGTASLAKIPLNRRNLWLCAPILFFAAMLVFRANLFLSLINICATLGLGTLLLHYLASEDPLDTEPLPLMAGAASAAALRSVTDTTPELLDAWRYVRTSKLQQRQGMVAVVRGVIFTVPVLLVFAALLGSADQVFGSYLDRVLGMFSFNDMDALVTRGVITLMIGWVAIGSLSYALARRSYPVGKVALPTPAQTDESALPDTEKRKNTPIILTMIETTMILGAVNLLFAAFVIIQFAYLFGGQAAITDQGFTYSEYARRGFYELLAVTVLSLGMALFLDWVTIRRGAREHTLFKGLSVLLSALVGVMIVSASQRMALYEQVYGFTDDRVYAHLFILWLGGLFVAFVLHLFRVRKNIFALGALLFTIGYTAHLNLLNVDLYIAEQNIARYHAGEDLDMCYLRSLSVDALPAMLALREEVSPENTVIYNQLTMWFTGHLYPLENAQSVFSFNTARSSAWQILSAMSDQLSADYAKITDWSSCYYRTPDRF